MRKNSYSLDSLETESLIDSKVTNVKKVSFLKGQVSKREALDCELHSLPIFLGTRLKTYERTSQETINDFHKV